MSPVLDETNQLPVFLEGIGCTNIFVAWVIAHGNTGEATGLNNMRITHAFLCAEE